MYLNTYPIVIVLLSRYVQHNNFLETILYHFEFNFQVYSQHPPLILLVFLQLTFIGVNVTLI